MYLLNLILHLLMQIITHYISNHFVYTLMSNMKEESISNALEQ